MASPQRASFQSVFKTLLFCSLTFGIRTAAPAHGARPLCVAVKQQQARGVRPDPSQRPAVLQQPGSQGNPLWQDSDAVSEGKHTQSLDFFNAGTPTEKN